MIEKSLEEIRQGVEAVLGREGLLARNMDGFGFRAGQLKMAFAVAETIYSGGRLVVEAGTGIGKTLAYLVPVLLSGARTVVSTGTKTLQEQIFRKDLPSLARALGIEVRAALLKGRANYLCLYRFHTRPKDLIGLSSDPYWRKLSDWARQTETGDRAELEDLPDDHPLWQQVAALPDTCLGSKCPYFQRCFLVKRNRAAAAADIVVVNHHLFFADLALKDDDGVGSVLPAYEVVIFDEAHQVESTATQYFGVQVSSAQLVFAVDEYARLIKRATAWGVPIPSTFSNLVLGIRKRINELVEPWILNLTESMNRNEGTRRKLVHSALTDEELTGYKSAQEALSDLSLFAADAAAMVEKTADSGKLKASQEEWLGLKEELLALSRRASRYYGALELIFEPDDIALYENVFFVERRPRSLIWGRFPVDVAEVLRERLLSLEVGFVFTSATLSAGGGFDFFTSQIGLSPDTPALTIPSPFITPENVALFVPRNFPEPRDPQFLTVLPELLKELIDLAGGGVLVLFTSYASLNAAREALEGKLEYECLFQGDGSAPRLLERFRERVDSVLFATGTFWEGIDVMGESLRMVIIDKLPFDPPDDPFTEAKRRMLERRGKDPFQTYQLPRAILALKQGLGRLLRSPTDSGLWALLDSRVLTKGYGRKILGSLPKVNLLTDLDDVRYWWQNIKR